MMYLHSYFYLYAIQLCHFTALIMYGVEVFGKLNNQLQAMDSDFIY